MAALGDVWVAQAELAASQQPQAAAQLLQLALQDGYGAALRVNSLCPEGLIGTAEAHCALGSLALNGRV